MTDQPEERGPNGIPYVDPDRTDIGKWESGVYHVRLGRQDGELLNLNFKQEQFHALLSGIIHTLEQSDDEITVAAVGEQVKTYDGDVAYTVRVGDVPGFPDTVVKDLQRADGRGVDRIHMAHWYHHDAEQSVVVIRALDDNAMKWLYDWLEDTKEHYKKEYVDAGGEYDAARELADAVYEAVQE